MGGGLGWDVPPHSWEWVGGPCSKEWGVGPAPTPGMAGEGVRPCGGGRGHAGSCGGGQEVRWDVWGLWVWGRWEPGHLGPVLYPPPPPLSQLYLDPINPPAVTRVPCAGAAPHTSPGRGRGSRAVGGGQCGRTRELYGLGRWGGTLGCVSMVNAHGRGRRCSACPACRGSLAGWTRGGVEPRWDYMPHNALRRGWEDSVSQSRLQPTSTR